MKERSKTIHVRIDDEAFQEFKDGLRLKGETLQDWVVHQITLEIVRNRPLVEAERKSRQQWKKDYFNIQGE